MLDAVLQSSLFCFAVFTVPALQCLSYRVLKSLMLSCKVVYSALQSFTMLDAILHGSVFCFVVFALQRFAMLDGMAVHIRFAIFAVLAMQSFIVLDAVFQGSLSLLCDADSVCFAMLCAAEFCSA